MLICFQNGLFLLVMGQYQNFYDLVPVLTKTFDSDTILDIN